MQLTKNFTLQELVLSQTAKRKQISNIPNDVIIQNLTKVTKAILQPVRDHFNLPVKVSSGYRSPELNKAVGGSINSQHCLGLAVDFTINNIDNAAIAKWIQANLEYDQLILEFYTGSGTGWVHCSYVQNKNRMQELTINRKGTFNGLVYY
jgi:hypothetical protein